MENVNGNEVFAEPKKKKKICCVAMSLTLVTFFEYWIGRRGEW